MNKLKKQIALLSTLVAASCVGSPVPAIASEFYKGALPLLCTDVWGFNSEMKDLGFEIKELTKIDVYNDKAEMSTVQKILLENLKERQMYLVDESGNFCLVYSEEIKEL